MSIHKRILSFLEDPQKYKMLADSLNEKNKNIFDGMKRYHKMCKDEYDTNGQRTIGYQVKEHMQLEIKKIEDQFCEVLIDQSEDVKEDTTIILVKGGAFVVEMTDIALGMLEQTMKAFKAKEGIGINYGSCMELLPSDLVENVNRIIEHVSKENKKIIVISDSAGSYTATLAVINLNEIVRSKIEALVYLSPWLNLEADTKSYVDNLGNDFYLSPSGIVGLCRDMYKSKLEEDHGIAKDGLNNMSKCKFPPVLIQVGTKELCYDDSINFANELNQLGTKVTLEVYENMYHCFQLWDDFIKTKNLAWKNVAIFGAKLN